LVCWLLDIFHPSLLTHSNKDHDRGLMASDS
jgi:hypothetical protein